MNRLSKCVFAAFAVLLLGFSATPCRAQNEDPLLYAGLLGYTGGIEDEATLLSPAAIGQVFSGPAGGAPLSASQTQGHPDWKISLRLGDFSFKNDGAKDLAGSQFFYGIGMTKNLSDHVSFRGSFDYISGDYSESDEFKNYFDWEMDTFSVKTTALIHPAAGTLGAGRSGYFNPYIGMGLEINLSTINDWFDDGVMSSSSSESDTAFGIHFLAGIDYVFDNFSLGLEFSYNCAEADFYDGHGKGEDTAWDLGGLSILLNLGFGF